MKKVVFAIILCGLQWAHADFRCIDVLTEGHRKNLEVKEFLVVTPLADKHFIEFDLFSTSGKSSFHQISTYQFARSAVAAGFSKWDSIGRRKRNGQEIIYELVKKNGYFGFGVDQDPTSVTTTTIIFDKSKMTLTWKEKVEALKPHVQSIPEAVHFVLGCQKI